MTKHAGTGRETKLARVVIAWLQERNWDVYQEVSPPSSNAIADIVAIQQRRVWVIECKTSLGFSVLAQAVEWQRRNFAHWVYVATPELARCSDGARFAERVARDAGIGVIRVGNHFGARERVRGRLNRHANASEFLNTVCQEHKTFAEAGSSGTSHWSLFRQTCERVADYVRRHPGQYLKSVIDGIEHHYASDSSARSSMTHWVLSGKVPGVVARRDGRFWRLYPEEIGGGRK